MILTAKNGCFSAAISRPSNDNILRRKAEELGKSLNLPLIAGDEWHEHDFILVYTEKGLELRNRTGVSGTLYVDFNSEQLGYRRLHGGGTKEALARAVGVKPNVRPSIIDATAGMGIDSFMLACTGCRVKMIERSPILGALLQDGLERLALDNPTLLLGEAKQLLKDPANKADTVYLDPMYPHRRKKALNKQNMRIIRELIGDDHDADITFRMALRCARQRVVVKRPKGAPMLDECRPSHVIRMKNSRYDVYLVSVHNLANGQQIKTNKNI